MRTRASPSWGQVITTGSPRERVHDLGVFKAVGMTPRQVIAMVGATGLIVQRLHSG
jgi:hypothetical protein